MTLTVSADHLDEKIRLLRAQHGESQADLARAVTAAGISISRDIIQRLEKHADEDRAITEDKADPFVIAAIADHYGRNTSELSEVAAARMKERQALLRIGRYRTRTARGTFGPERRIA